MIIRSGESVPNANSFLQPGARIQLEAENVAISCRVAAVHGKMLHLLLPRTTDRQLKIAAGERITISAYQPNTRWEAESTAREFVWGSPIKMVVGPVGQWRRTGRHRAPRSRCRVFASLSVGDSMEFFGQTEDLSSTGVSLLLAGYEGIGDNAVGNLTLRTRLDVWCEGLPIRTIYVRKWFRPGGRAYQVGAMVKPATDEQQRQWDECLARTVGEQLE